MDSVLAIMPPRKPERRAVGGIKESKCATCDFVGLCRHRYFADSENQIFLGYVCDRCKKSGVRKRNAVQMKAHTTDSTSVSRVPIIQVQQNFCRLWLYLRSVFHLELEEIQEGYSVNEYGIDLFESLVSLSVVLLSLNLPSNS